jgi:hypothetical protein
MQRSTSHKVQKQARRLLDIGAFASAALLVAACGGDDSSTLPVLPVAGVGGSSAIPTSTAAGTPAVVSTGPAGAAGNTSVTAGASATSTAGSPATPAVAGSAAPDEHMHAGAAGSGAMMAMAANACKLQAKLDPRDEMLTDEPLMMTVGIDQDLLVPQLVLDWMAENQFAEAHDAWHLVRKWDQSCRKSNATASSCAAAQRLVSQGLSRAAIQQAAPGDGLAFMMMHRHMIHMLKTTFPKHTKLFAGFGKVPKSQNDPENPTPWRAVSWTSNNTKGFDTLENIEQHLDQFATEDDLGQYIENTYRWTESNPMTAMNLPGSGLHGALHSQWAVNGSPANLIQQAVDVRNFTFWKLHGWIDDVWERYRKAKGLTDDDPQYQQLMLEQCMEMFTLQPRNRPTTGGNTGAAGSGAAGSGATVPETGAFATSVRPFLDSTCGGCHSPIAPSAGMTLGGMGISSAEIRTGLVSVKSTNGEYDLIAPGAPEKSWVYLKASGDVANVTCTSLCDRETMPPSGVGLSAAQLTTLRTWIMNGATDK